MIADDAVFRFKHAVEMHEIYGERWCVEGLNPWRQPFSMYLGDADSEIRFLEGTPGVADDFQSLVRRARGHNPNMPQPA